MKWAIHIGPCIGDHLDLADLEFCACRIMAAGIDSGKIITNDRRRQSFVGDHLMFDSVTEVDQFICHKDILFSVHLVDYFVAKIPPTTLVISSLPSRLNQRVATSVIFPINASYSSLPLNMDVHNLRSSLKEART